MSDKDMNYEQWNRECNESVFKSALPYIVFFLLVLGWVL